MVERIDLRIHIFTHTRAHTQRETNLLLSTDGAATRGPGGDVTMPKDARTPRVWGETPGCQAQELSSGSSFPSGNLEP